MLSAHPQIMIRSVFPFETRAFQYYSICSIHKREKIDFNPVSFSNVEYRPYIHADKASHGWAIERGRMPDYALLMHGLAAR